MIFRLEPTTLSDKAVDRKAQRKQKVLCIFFFLRKHAGVQAWWEEMRSSKSVDDVMARCPTEEINALDT